MWEIRILKVYDSERRGGLQYRRSELSAIAGHDQAGDTEILEAAVNELLPDGWEPFAYSDYGVTMWLRREVPAP